MRSAGGPQRGLRIAGCGTALPSDLGLGADGARALEAQDCWALLLGPDWQAELARRGWDAQRAAREWGVVERQWLHRPGGEPLVERGTERLMLHAARAALDAAATRAGELDLIVTASSTPDRIGASLAARLAAELGSDAACFDLRAGGAGGVLAWITAARWLGGGARRALVVAGETASAYLHAGDAASALLFGDAASALVLERDDGPGGLLAACAARAPGRGRAFTVPGALPPTSGQLESGAYRLAAPDAEYLASLAGAWSELADGLAEALAGLPAARRELLAGSATRAGAHTLAARLGLSSEPTCSVLQRHGACGAAGPGLVLARSARARGDQLVLAAVGGGLHSAGLVWEA